MGCTRAELLGWLPRIIGDARHAWSPDGVNIALGEGTVRIAWREQPPRRIAGLTLPVLAVTLQFDRVEVPVQERFLARFDLHTRRGGG